MSAPATSAMPQIMSEQAKVSGPSTSTMPHDNTDAQVGLPESMNYLFDDTVGADTFTRKVQEHFDKQEEAQSTGSTLRDSDAEATGSKTYPVFWNKDSRLKAKAKTKAKAKPARIIKRPAAK